MKKPEIVPREEILEVLRAAAPRALHIGAIGSELGVTKSRRRALGELLEDLALTGRVDVLPGARYRISQQTLERELARGEFKANPRGFGFVVRDDAGPDVFIDVPNIAGAMHHDTVEVEVNQTPRGPAGQVLRVIERALTRIPGLLRVTAHAAWLDPDDARIRSPLELEPEGLKISQNGRAAVVEITQYPERYEDRPVGRLVLELGEPGDPRVELDKILYREGITPEFPPEVLAQAGDLARPPTAEELEGRTDLRHVPFLTIDPIDARDHDDAVQIGTHPLGYQVRVAIADVSHYVRPGTPLDTEARDRATSIYLPGRVIPMLPMALSADMCSLVAGQDRLALVAEAILSPSGELLESRYVAAVIRPAASLHYEGVARALGLTSSAMAQPEAEEHLEQLRQMHDLTRTLRRRRIERGSIDFNLPEPKVELDPDSGVVRGITRRAQDPGVKIAYSIVEEMMLLTNELVARELGKRGLPTIYRVHAAPDEEKLEVFCELARSLGNSLTVEEGQAPGKLAAFLRSLEGRALERPLTSLLLRTMKQAQYDVTNIGHFGLASTEYLHFTSPIRRYPDMVVHRTLHAMLNKRPPPIAGPAGDEHLQALIADATRSSKRERRAMEVEREVVDLYRALYMRDHVGEVFDARVTGLAPHGLYVEFAEPFAEGLILFETLKDDIYEPDEARMRVSGVNTGRKFVLGDELRVVVSDVSISRRTVYVELAEKREPAPSSGDHPARRQDREAATLHGHKAGGPRPRRATRKGRRGKG